MAVAWLVGSVALSSDADVWGYAWGVGLYDAGSEASVAAASCESTSAVAGYGEVSVSDAGVLVGSTGAAGYEGFAVVGCPDGDDAVVADGGCGEGEEAVVES